MKVSDFKSEDDLKKMKVVDIKKHVREFNQHYKIAGYSKLKKDQIINVILTAQNRISNAGKSPAPAPAPANTDKKRRTELGRFRREALLPIVSQQNKYYGKPNDGKVFVSKPVQNKVFNMAKSLKKDATPAEKKAIDALLTLYRMAVTLNEENNFQALYGRARLQMATINQALKEAKLKGLPRD